MTTFDWILLAVALFWGGINLLSIIVALSSPMARMPGFKITLTPMFFVPPAMLLFIAYRVWG